MDCWFITFVNVSYRTTCKYNIVICCTNLLQTYYECFKKHIVRMQWRKHGFMSGIKILWRSCECQWRSPCRRPSTSTNDKNTSTCAMLCEVTNKRVFTKHAKVGTLVGSAHSIQHKDFSMHCLCQHLVLKILPPENKKKNTKGPFKHPPYFPHLSPSGFFLFLWLKSFLKRRQFASTAEKSLQRKHDTDKRYWEAVSRIVSSSFTNSRKSMSLSKGATWNFLKLLV